MKISDKNKMVLYGSIADKIFDTILETTVLEGIKFYVEEDLTLENLNWKMPQDFPPHQKKFTKELRYIYKLITVNLPKLEKELEIAWSKISSESLGQIKSRVDNWTEKTYKDKYGAVDSLELKIKNMKTKIIIWAANNRKSIWY